MIFAWAAFGIPTCAALPGFPAQQAHDEFGSNLRYHAHCQTAMIQKRKVCASER
jgi:hypothetical protein